MGSIDEGQVGFVNGYVQPPEGHPDLGGDHRDLDPPVHRGLTYGVDERGWVGFGTGHAPDQQHSQPTLTRSSSARLAVNTPQPRCFSLMRQWPHCRESRPRADPTPPVPRRGTATGPSRC